MRGRLGFVAASLIGCRAEAPPRAPEAVVIAPPAALGPAVAPAPMRALSHASYVSGSPCELSLDVPREPTEQELLALLMPTSALDTRPLHVFAGTVTRR